MKLGGFISRLDKQAVRAIGVTFGGFAVAAVLIVLGRNYLGIDESVLQSRLSVVAGSPWALPVCVLVFTLAAFIGVPQWALIAGAVAAFWPLYGFVYSWVSVMISASVDFMVGRKIGSQRLSRFTGQAFGFRAELCCIPDYDYRRNVVCAQTVENQRINYPIREFSARRACFFAARRQ